MFTPRKAILTALTLTLACLSNVWAQPSSEPWTGNNAQAYPTPTATQQPTPTPRPTNRLAPQTATTAAATTRTYTRDPVITVGDIQVENNRTTVGPGESVRLWIDTPTDYDSWTQGTENGQELDDTLFGKWSNGATGYSITWTAPTTQGQYRPKITVNDDITRGSTNGRNDLLVEKAVTITVVRPTVEKVQWRNPSDAASVYQDVGTEAMNVLKGTRLIFKAIPTPNVAWPTGQPVWSGAGSGTGATVAVIFDSLSTTTSDYKTLTARSGNSITANIVVYELVLSTKADDDFEGRTEEQYGVGESVALNYKTQPEGLSVDIDWVRIGGNDGGSISDSDDKWKVGETATTSSFKAEISSGPSRGGFRTLSREVVAPTLRFVETPMSNIFHSSNDDVNGNGTIEPDEEIASVGFLADIYLEPKNVSFKNVEVREKPDVATPDSNLSEQTIQADGVWIRTGDNGQLESTFHTVGPPAYVGPGNIETGSRVGGNPVSYTDPVTGATSEVSYHDQVLLAVRPWFGSYVHPTTGATITYRGGTVVWSIPWQYKVVSNVNFIWRTIGVPVTQTMTISTTGRATISKFGFTHFKELHDPVADAFFPWNGIDRQGMTP